MSEDMKSFKVITELTLASLDGSISSEQFKLLQDKIKSSKAAREHYLECLAVCISLNQYEEESIKSCMPQGIEKEEYFNDVLQALAENEKVADTVEVEKPQEHQTEQVYIQKAETGHRKISRISIYAFIFSAAAMLFMAVLVLLTPVKPVLAVLTDSRNAVWLGSDEDMIKGTELRQGPLLLKSGYANIVLTNDVEIVMHGPVTIDIESVTQVFLSKGSIFSKVPKGAGDFLVRTPGATVVDYGTEFAVEVDSEGATSAHVFIGEVELRSGADIIKHGEAKRLLANQAAAVDSKGALFDVEFVPEKYVTSVPSAYDMEVLNSNPSAYWRFANYGDYPVNEVDLNGFKASYVGNVSFTDSLFLNRNIHNQSLSLDGQGSHVSIQIENRQTSRKGWTYALWIRPELSTNIKENSSLHYILVGEGKYGYLTLSDKGTLEHCFRRNDTTKFGTQTSNEVLKYGRWYHIAVTVESTSTKKLYINGIEVSGPSTRESTSLISGSFCKKILIGTVFEKSAAFKRGPLDKPFKGDISQVALYDRALSEDTIKELYLSSNN